jgi:catechol 2,3-dioxygenase-like lactoylglutathione lyase family enzyme
MFAKIKHLAIISDNYTLLSRFYEALFGMRTSKSPRPESAVAIGDGYVGMNIIPQKLGRQAGLEHFGLEVEDVEKIGARLREKYPAVQLIKRPTNRPFAGISTHDPEGYVFDLSQQDMTNRAEVYVDGEWKQDRYVSHFVLRALNPANLAKFYREIYELQELEKPADDPSHYLTDGRVTLVVSPWAITDYEGAGIEPRHMDHLGFKVEDVDSFKKDLQALVKRNPALAPKPGGTEGDIRLKLLAKCKHGQFQLADPDGVPIDVSSGRWEKLPHG